MDFHQSNKLFFFLPVLFEMHCNDAQYTVTFQYFVVVFLKQTKNIKLLRIWYQLFTKIFSHNLFVYHSFVLLLHYKKTLVALPHCFLYYYWIFLSALLFALWWNKNYCRIMQSLFSQIRSLFFIFFIVFASYHACFSLFYFYSRISI
jgi:hypothetical protein